MYKGQAGCSKLINTSLMILPFSWSAMLCPCIVQGLRMMSLSQLRPSCIMLLHALASMIAGAGSTSVWGLSLLCWILGFWGPHQPRNGSHSARAHWRRLACRGTCAAGVPLHLQVGMYAPLLPAAVCIKSMFFGGQLVLPFLMSTLCSRFADRQKA